MEAPKRIQDALAEFVAACVIVVIGCGMVLGFAGWLASDVLHLPPSMWR